MFLDKKKIYIYIPPKTNGWNLISGGPPKGKGNHIYKAPIVSNVQVPAVSFREVYLIWFSSIMKAFFFDKFHQTLKWTCLKLTNIFRSFALAERQVSPNIQMHGCLKLTKIFRLQNFRSLTFFPREIGETPPARPHGWNLTIHQIWGNSSWKSLPRERNFRCTESSRWAPSGFVLNGLLSRLFLVALQINTLTYRGFLVHSI